jgi:hypothetical protein
VKAKFHVIVAAIPNPGHNGVTDYMQQYADEVLSHVRVTFLYTLSLHSNNDMFAR